MKTIYLKPVDCLRILATSVSRGLWVLAAMALAAVTAAPAKADINLVFGTYAADKPTETVRKYRSFLHYMSQEMTKALGEPVTIRMKIAKDYETGIDHLANGEVDFARFGPASYITVYERNSDVQIIAMESVKGQKRFKGIIAVHADSKIQTLSDLAQHSFAFGNPLSTIGRYLAQSHLIEAGVTSNELSGYEFLGRHDRVGTAVGAGRFTAGALKESTYKKLVTSGVPIRVLFEFENVTKPWLATSDMDPNVLTAMRQIMLKTTDTEVLGSIAKDGFVDGTDADYDFVRDAMIQSRMF